MRGIKVSQMTDIGNNISNEDYLYVIDVDNGNLTRKTTVGNLANFVSGNTSEDGKTIIKSDNKLAVNLDNSTLKYDQINRNIYATSQTSSAITTNITVGGLTKGTEISKGTSLDEILRSILVTYIEPAFSSFTCAGFNTSDVEVGTTVSATNSNCNWNYNDSLSVQNIKSSSIGIKLDNTELASNYSGDNTSCTVTFSKTLANVGSSTMTISGTNTNNVTFSRSITKQWKYKYFSGHNNLTDINSLTITTGTSGWGPSNSTTLTINASATDRMVWFAYPTSVITNTPKIIQTTSLNADVSATFSSVNKSYTLPNNTSINYTVKYFIFPEAPGKTETYSITL